MSPQLEWIPLYLDNILGSPRWQQMADFQRGWYIQLLLNSARSERPGFLRLDSNLWTIAGAKRRDFFESHKSAVLACFKVREIEGESWIFNERLLRTLDEQHEKLRKKRPRDGPVLSPSYSLFLEGSEEIPDLPPSALSRGVLENLDMPLTKGNLFAVIAAIECEMKRQSVKANDAAQFIYLRAMEARTNGERVDKFWFEDSRWREDGQTSASKSVQRVNNTRNAISNVLRARVVERVGYNGGECQDGTDGSADCRNDAALRKAASTSN